MHSGRSLSAHILELQTPTETEHTYVDGRERGYLSRQIFFNLFTTSFQHCLLPIFLLVDPYSYKIAPLYEIFFYLSPLEYLGGSQAARESPAEKHWPRLIMNGETVQMLIIFECIIPFEVLPRLKEVHNSLIQTGIQTDSRIFTETGWSIGLMVRGNKSGLQSLNLNSSSHFRLSSGHL